MLKYIISVIIINVLWNHVDSSRILAVIPTASYSHQMFYQQLWREFAIRGHEVVVITTDPTNESLPNLREISIRDCHAPNKQLLHMMINDGYLSTMLNDNFLEIAKHISRLQLHNPGIQELINNKDIHFDVIMIEHTLHPMFGLQHRFKCPIIGVMSLDGTFDSHSIMGNADHSILYPTTLVTLGDNPTLMERMVAVVMTNALKWVQASFTNFVNEISRETFGEDMPSIQDIMEQIDMLFVNANPVLNAVRPHTPSTINIAGGMHMKPAKPLPKNIKDFLDNSKQGAIYLSLGSNVKSNELTMELRQIFLDTLAQLPYNILWKFEDDNLPGKPNNVMITRWAPQQDILRHKNVKMFITQGGLQSLEESLYSYVPVVIIPFFADQECNARRAADKGIGNFVNRHTVTTEVFKEAILEVMNNPIYRETVKRLATQIQDTPMTPLERAVWWTEYVIRNKGAQHLKGPKIPLYQYYYIDVLAVIGLTVFVLVGLIVASFGCCIKFVNRLISGKPSITAKLKQN